MIDDFRAGQPSPAKQTDETTTKIDPPAVEVFQTPEDVASEQALDSSVEQPVLDHPLDETPKRKNFLGILKANWPPTRKQASIIGVIAVVLIGGVSSLVMHLSGNKQVVATTKHVIKVAPVVAKPTTVPSTLSGLPVDPSVNSKPVTAVMVENSLDARPQAGLSAAGVVFEAVAEGGITRFMALYQDTAPTNVGPIRSARPYYVQWALGFDAAYAHVGGSPDALADIKSWDVKDMNQFYNGGSFHRITTRQAPHNVYTGINNLNSLEASKGFTTSKYTGFARKPEAPSKTPTASSIKLTLSGYYYDAQFNYAPATNSYNRSEAGAALMDSNTNTQISPKVVVAIVVPLARGKLDSSGAYYSNYNPIGSGTAYVFQDGVETTGTWTKSANTAPLTFTNADGTALKLNPGQTWITAVSSTSSVSYKP